MLELVKKQRGMPFLKKGMKVLFSPEGKIPKIGIIKDGNDCGNLDILFDGEDHTDNCHPYWKLTYYDDSGEVIEYK